MAIVIDLHFVIHIESWTYLIFDPLGVFLRGDSSEIWETCWLLIAVNT